MFLKLFDDLMYSQIEYKVQELHRTMQIRKFEVRFWGHEIWIAWS